MRRVPGAFLLAVLLACGPVLAAECDPSKAGAKISYDEKIQPIFGGICAQCHNTMETPEGLVLEAGLALDLLVNVRSVQSPLKRVEPGDPEKSYLVHKLRGTQDSVGGSGQQMPAGLAPLRNEDIDLVVQWIKACSPAN